MPCGAWLAVSCCSLTSCPLNQTVTFGASPSTRRRTRFQSSRFQACDAALGVPELWLVDLEQRAIEQRVLTDGRWAVAGSFAGAARVRSHVFPGLVVVPAEVFPDPAQAG